MVCITNETWTSFNSYFDYYNSYFAVLVTDRRTYKDRRDVWAIEKKKSEVARERPKAKIRHNTPPPEENPLRKKAPSAARDEPPAKREEELVS